MAQHERTSADGLEREGSMAVPAPIAPVVRRALPMPPSHPRKLGPIRRFAALARSSIHSLYDKSYDMKLGDVRGPTRTFFFLNDVPLVNRVLGADAERYPKGRVMSGALRPLLGESIFVANGDVWRKQRRMLDPAFERARITAVFEPMVDAAVDMNARLAPLADGRSLHVDPELIHVTADVIFRTIFSETLPRERADALSEAFERYHQRAWWHTIWIMAGVPTALSWPRMRSRDPARRIRAILGESIDRRLAEHARGGAAHDDILQSMIVSRDPETGEAFDREALIDQVASIFFAGHETSAAALAWTLFLLGRHPEHLARVERESAAFWADGRPQARNLRLLRHTRDCLREAMRLYPPIAFASRDVAEEEEMRGKRIAKGSGLFVSPYLMHRQRRIWSRPDEFDPDRFSRAEEREAVRDAYMPFIKGPRVCLGASFALQEGVIILSAIASRFRVEDDPGHEPEPIARLTLRSANGIRLRLHRLDEGPNG